MDIFEQLQHSIRHVAKSEVMPRFLRVGSSIKADGTLMTEADVAAQKALETLLPEILPSPVLGEEMSAQAQQDLWKYADEGLWVVDPIDGTTNFVNGIPHFALSVAWVQGGQSRLGVVYQPKTDEMFAAKEGYGAFLNGQKLSSRKTKSCLKDAVAGVEVKYLRSGTLAKRIHNLSPCASQRNMGCSTLDWCYLASGRFDVYVHGGQKLWDYAAGALIFTEAGGHLATLEGDDFWSGKHIFQRSVIAALQENLFADWLTWVRANQ